VAALGAVAAAPDFPDYHALVASVALEQGDLPTAEASLRTAMAFLPGGVRFHRLLADVLRRVGRDRDAADLLADLVARTPWDERALIQLGWAYRRLPDLQAAEDAFRRAIEIDPEDEYARIGLVNTLNEQKRFNESLAILHSNGGGWEQKPRNLCLRGQSPIGAIRPGGCRGIVPTSN
jgi:tetratricopeptide (TPR) repeat protein